MCRPNCVERGSRAQGRYQAGLMESACSRDRTGCHRFDFADSAAYERFVGSWGRAAGAEFLAWLDPPVHANWLDVGCGTGLFTELIVETRSPSAVVAIDPAQAQIEYAKHKPIAKAASFRVGDAQALPLKTPPSMSLHQR